jgi:hypothetical protein
MKTILTLLFFSFFFHLSNAQKTKTQVLKGTVWVNIPNYTSLGITKKSKNSIASSNSVMSKLISTYSIYDVFKAVPTTKSPRLSKVYEIKCHCDAEKLKEAIDKETTLFKNALVMGEPVPLFEPNDYSLAIPNDYALNLINAKEAWDITKGDSSVLVAVIDENYYPNHEDLVNKISYISPNNPSLKFNHGTMVAIMAAGNTNNNTGKSSIGYKTNLQLRRNGWGEIMAAVNSGARIINISWCTNSCVYNQYEQDIINEAYENGAIIIASAGNATTCGGQNNPHYPAAYDHVISVTSVGPYDNHERIPGNSSTAHNHHTSVDICAPGYGVALSGEPGKYIYEDGTSFAAPLVSGTVALMLAVNKCLTADQVEEILKETAVNIYPSNQAYVGKLGAGRIDAKAAVQMAASYATRPNVIADKTIDCATNKQGLSINTTGLSGPFTVNWSNGQTGTAITNLNAGTYSAIVRDGDGCVAKLNPITLTTIQPMTITSVVSDVRCNGMNNGSINTTVTGGSGGYSYTWSNGSTIADPLNLKSGIYNVTVKDSKNCQQTASIEIKEPAKLTATIVKMEGTHRASGSLDLTPAGGTTPYTYIWNNGAITQDLNNLKKGYYSVQVTDAKSCKVSANATITVLSNTVRVNPVKN